MVVDAYKALAQVILVERPMTDVLEEIAAIAKNCLPGAEAASTTLVRGDRARTPASSGALALEADELQYEEGYGPCMDAGHTGMPLVVTDMRTEDRRPSYSARVVERAVRHMPPKSSVKVTARASSEKVVTNNA